MYYNREMEIKRNKKISDAWNISKKYTSILINNSKNDRNINVFPIIYGQFINELRNKKIIYSDTKNYIQCWNTTLNTIYKNPKIKCKRAAIKLLHQTSVQRSHQH